MSVSELVAEIQQMKSSEKLDLIEALWENLAQEYDQAEIPLQHQEEIQSRYDSYLKNPKLAQPWEAAKKEILNRYANRNSPRSSK